MNEIGPQQQGAGAAQPSVYTDRRALSEAWYQALFDARRGARGGTETILRRQSGEPAASALPRPPCAAARTDVLAREPAPKPERAPVRLIRATFAAPNRMPAVKQRQTAAALPAARTAVAKRTLCRAVLPDGAGVDLLVQQRGDILRLVAVYDGRSAQRVAAALHAARAALHRRGLRTEIDAIQKGSS